MRTVRLAAVVSGFVLVAAACGGGTDDDPGAAPAPEPTTTAATTDTTPTTPPETTGGPTAPTTTSTSPPATTGGDPPEPAPDILPPGAVAEGWSVLEIADGTKPVLALDSTGSPGIAFLTERIGEGYVAYASAEGGWDPDRFVEGYFYGPIGLDYDPEDDPHIVWHDHQADTFELDLGTLMHATNSGGDWVFTEGTDDGHDGWDSTVAVGPEGIVRAAGVDPVQFNRQDGVEYYELVDGEFIVEDIGSGPIAYEFNVSLDVDALGRAALTYFDTDEESLQFARRTGGGWVITTVDEGNAGKYSSLALDADGLGHVSYYHQTGSSTGTVRYAFENADGTWVIEDIARLDEVRTGFTGARRITSIALRPDGTPVVAFSDEGGIYTATRNSDGWFSRQIIAAGSRPLGQLVSFAVDDTGNYHLAYFEVTNTSPLDGVVFYATTS